MNRAARLRVFGTEWKQGGRMIRDADCIGYNYRMHELTAAFTLARLDVFHVERSERINNARRLAEGLQGIPGISVPIEQEDRSHIYQMFRVRLSACEAGFNLNNRDFRRYVCAALNAENAEWWEWETNPLPAYSVFQTLNAEGRGFPWSLSETRKNMRYNPLEYPIAKGIADDSLFTYAHYPGNSPELIEQHILAFRKVWGHLEDLLRCSLPPDAGHSNGNGF
jgi:perosamine synthetase